MGGKSADGSGAIFVQRKMTIKYEARQRRLCFPVFVFAALALALLATELGDRPLSGREPRSRRGVQRASIQSFIRFPVKLLKSTLKHYLRVFGDAPLISPVVHSPGVKRVLSILPGSRVLYGSNWDRKHPFDRLHGTDTSGFLSGDDILTGHPAEDHGSPYAGAQPSVLRTVLATLPRLKHCTFIDLGCGKGRPMLVASEFPFRDIVGVELSPPLAEVARKNAAIIGTRYPGRTPVRVEVGDATAYPMPEGDVVLFIYNSFDRELMLEVVEGVEAALAADAQRSIYVVYCNPASGDCFDASPLLTRRYAQMLPYTPEEQGFAEDAADAIIVWQGGNAPLPAPRADARIVIVKERWRAELMA